MVRQQHFLVAAATTIDRTSHGSDHQPLIALISRFLGVQRDRVVADSRTAIRRLNNRFIDGIIAQRRNLIISSYSALDEVDRSRTRRGDRSPARRTNNPDTIEEHGATMAI